MKIAVLGYSEAALTMIADILESQKDTFEIVVIDNLKLTEHKTVPSFPIDFHIVDRLPEDFDGYFLIGPINVRNKIYLYKLYPFPADNFINIFHCSSIISGTTVFGRGCVTNAGTVIAGQSKIGNFVYLNRKVSIGHHTNIGDFVTINPGCNIAGHVNIGEQCQIGMGVNIIDGITIGNNSIIGAGSLVLKDIPENCVAYGNPCRIVRENLPVL